MNIFKSWDFSKLLALLSALVSVEAQTLELSPGDTMDVPVGHIPIHLHDGQNRYEITGFVLTRVE